MKEKPRDLTQQVYDWELSLGLFLWARDIPADKQLTMDECKAIVVDACTLSQSPPPHHVSEERYWTDRYCAWCDHTSRCLGFPEDTRQPAIVLHEVAHLVTRHGHDAVFVEKYIALLDVFNIRPRWELEATAHEYGIL